MINLANYSTVENSSDFIVNWLTNGANDETEFYFIMYGEPVKATAPQFFNYLWKHQNETHMIFYSELENRIILR